MNAETKRVNRKLEHIRYAHQLKGGPVPTGFDDITLIHMALPDLDLDEVDITVEFLNKTLSAPILINAITGGNPGVKQINTRIAIAAAETGIGVAVGSQKAALTEPALVDTYKVVRELNPRGLVLGNLSADSSLEDAKRAVEMIEADGLQLHLNVAQELTMSEGDRSFKRLAERIHQIVEGLHVPVIVKEVGFGIGYETAQQLKDLGVKYVDVGGAGGTNFVAVEYARQTPPTDESLIHWGIPTVCSLFETVSAGVEHVIASGGVQSALELAKCLSFGAELVGIAKICLDEILTTDGLSEQIEHLKENLRKILLLTNSKDLSTFQHCKKVVHGWLHHWIQERNLPVTS